MKIEVTQADIDQGETCSTSDCPVALAIIRAVGKELYISVKNERVYISPKFYPLPQEVQDFIGSFDGGPGCLPCRPFSFDLAYP